jgi:4-hydroxy-tetrahydrodipicolinate reductase
MNSQKQYNVAIEEIHHTQKLDAPSGTAITLAEGIIDNTDHNDQWHLKGKGNEKKEQSIEIEALREPNVPGTHEITYSSAIDTIEIKHTAHTREGFASGALMAALWLVGKHGVFNMKDLLGLD